MCSDPEDHGDANGASDVIADPDEVVPQGAQSGGVADHTTTPVREPPLQQPELVEPIELVRNVFQPLVNSGYLKGDVLLNMVTLFEDATPNLKLKQNSKHEKQAKAYVLCNELELAVGALLSQVEASEEAQSLKATLACQAQQLQETIETAQLLESMHQKVLQVATESRQVNNQARTAQSACSANVVAAREQLAAVIDSHFKDMRTVWSTIVVPKFQAAGLHLRQLPFPTEAVRSGSGSLQALEVVEVERYKRKVGEVLRDVAHTFGMADMCELRGSVAIEQVVAEQVAAERVVGEQVVGEHGCEDCVNGKSIGQQVERLRTTRAGVGQNEVDWSQSSPPRHVLNDYISVDKLLSAGFLKRQVMLLFEGEHPGVIAQPAAKRAKS